MPFWASIGLLSLVQSAIVAQPRRWAPRQALALRSRLWALLPAASVILFVAVAGAAARPSADALTYLALIAVPLLALLALGWLMRPATPLAALLALPLFALAWADRGGLAGQGAAVALTGLSCVSLGVLLGAVTPARWLALGILVMALADAALVASDLLQRPNEVLNATRPGGGLPQLQTAVFGWAEMGYGDLFVAGALGGLLVATGDRARQLCGAVLVAVLALMFDLLFFLVNELPATVPVALAVLLVALTDRRLGVSWARARPVPAAERSPL